ncbi:uncharacterized protein LOC128273601 [Anopheles cruzii]|uniref:uncharacterized protein LOC128273601 n=1 Tax=Anopheles cruzii TaxID=68878 RepID=UPI0022EC99C1|nr:uncharacterized protein LOC128273601 [Anopheles cruzii]
MALLVRKLFLVVLISTLTVLAKSEPRESALEDTLQCFKELSGVLNESFLKCCSTRGMTETVAAVMVQLHEHLTNAQQLLFGPAHHGSVSNGSSESHETHQEMANRVIMTVISAVEYVLRELNQTT